MANASRVCAECGATVFADAPQGVCSVCLFRTGLASLDNKDDQAFGPTVARMLKDFGDYELLEEIGRGGQGVVYRARQKSLNRLVALKVIGLAHWATEAHVKRFRLEAEAAASLNHPCIVPIYEVGERDGACYFSMGLVEGGQLDAVAKREPMPIRHAAELIAKLARTVHYAHERGILHRDIKPGNILLDAKGEPHLTDFGLARLVESESSVTHTLDVLGTPSYMAPEQAVGNNAAVCSATDVYGLGAVFYQLLTGHPPFAGGTTFETVRLVLDTEPRQPRLLNPKLDRDLATICLKCLEKDPKRRYASAIALAEDLEHWLKHEPILAHRTGIFTRGKKWVRRNPSIAVMAAMLLVLAVPLGVMIWKTGSERSPLSNVAPPEKSIAVLPFSNLSKEQENAFFADGVQDEILSNLAKVADLKVISRTSVMSYKSGTARNLRQIGRQLGVAHVVEGSVQRSGNRVRVNAQLIDARTDRHLWAQTYDRDLADVFAIQSEIAKTIADQLQAKLSPREENAIERSPTSDVSAFDLYARAKNILLTEGSIGKADKLRAVDLLTQAVARDPSFFDAYCQLAFAHDALYFFGEDHTSARLALAEAALQAASRLRPDAGETHLARGQNLYWAYGDYDGAVAELEVARQTLPNDARIFGLTGLIQRRQGRWEESTRNLERAVELNPRDSEMPVLGIASNYLGCRRYAEAKPWAARVLTFEPNNSFTKVFLAYLDFAWKADTRPMHQTIDSIRATNPVALPNIADIWIICALAERDAAAAKDALIAFGEEPIGFAPDNFRFNRPFAEGVIARMTRDDEKAQSAFTAARAEQEKIVQAQPNYGPALCALGLIDAGLGRKDEALREGRRAVELLPVEKDSMNGAAMVKYLAIIAAWVGDKNLACEQLASIIRRPSSLSYGQLKLLPFWDPLRGDPRFEKLVEESKQPVAIETMTSAPEKSIAVLPFENLSDDKQNAYFADGVQDEILTDLSRIADLKVISRTSVMPYKSGMARNLRQIGQQLGVAHVVEGSVQRSGNRVRVNAQLVDARTDRHLWAQTYDRDLADVFAIQSEIAKTIADQLQAKLNGQEKQAIAAKPTDNLEAYDVYLRGRAFAGGSHFEKSNVDRTIASFQEAVKLDPSFALAWARLSCAQSESYWLGLDPSPAGLAAAKDAADRALALDPNLPETHLALGYYRYYGQRDYTGGLAEFQQAERGLPNNVDVIKAIGLIQRRLGHWDETIVALRRIIELDPRDIDAYNTLAVTYSALRRFPEALATVDRALALEPANTDALGLKASVFWATGDLQAVEPLLANPGTEPLMPGSAMIPVRGVQALFQRRYAAAIEIFSSAVAAKTKRGEPSDNEKLFLGLSQQRAGDVASARATYEDAAQDIRRKLEKVAPDSYAAAETHAALGWAYAGLGEAASAIDEGQKAMVTHPTSKDPFGGPEEEDRMARICALLGDADHAIPILKRLLQIPYGDAITPALLRLDPMFDPLRNDPRFQKLVASATPK
jgi:TolB-like protein/Tfp pilus assembly protein PilF/predicted Ser/Thr protein kinase